MAMAMLTTATTITVMTTEASSLARLRLLQLASPTLPVGAYSYSQGLEAAVEAGDVVDAASAGHWIAQVLEHGVARLEAPVLVRLMAAWQDADGSRAAHWNERFIASRESAEFRAETLHMGYSLRVLLKSLALPGVTLLDEMVELALPTAWAFAAVAWGVEPRAALDAYLWAWAENQVLAAVKIVPLGQTDGQRLLLTLGEPLAAASGFATGIADEHIGAFMPHLALLSARHESQYSRLFRS